MTDTELLIRDCLSRYAEDAELADLVGPATAQGRALRRASEARYDVRPRLPRQHRLRFAVAGAAALVVAFVAVAFAFGGNHRATTTLLSRAQSTTPRVAVPDQGSAARRAVGQKLPSRDSFSEPEHLKPGTNDQGLPSTGYGQNGATPTVLAGAAPTSAAAGSTSGTGSGVTATRVVKTGSLALTVPRGQVQPTVSKLVALTTALGGYVSQSRTDNVAGSPEGDVTLRMPVGKFETAVGAAEKLGKQTSLTTDAHDVTGKFVDLNARLTALQHTRSTYLTILGHATTIGSTLEVQDRIDGVQSQIEQLQGEIKVLRNQSADGTLTVDVTQPGAHKAIRHHHSPSGISKAWHNSTRRFSRGVDAIVGALGPILLALLVLALFAAIAVVGRRLVAQRG